MIKKIRWYKILIVLLLLLRFQSFAQENGEMDSVWITVHGGSGGRSLFETEIVQKGTISSEEGKNMRYNTICVDIPICFCWKYENPITEFQDAFPANWKVEQNINLYKSTTGASIFQKIKNEFTSDIIADTRGYYEGEYLEFGDLIESNPDIVLDYSDEDYFKETVRFDNIQDGLLMYGAWIKTLATANGTGKGYTIVDRWIPARYRNAEYSVEYNVNYPDGKEETGKFTDNKTYLTLPKPEWTEDTAGRRFAFVGWKMTCEKEQ